MCPCRVQELSIYKTPDAVSAGSSLPQIGIVTLFDGQRRGGAVTGNHEGVGREGGQTAKGSLQGLAAAAGKVGATDGSGEEGVAAEEQLVFLEPQALAAGRVAGRVDHIGGDAAHSQGRGVRRGRHQR